MSQREGRPETCCSELLLRLMGCLLGAEENEWGPIWNGRSEARSRYHRPMERGMWVPKHRGRQIDPQRERVDGLRDVVVVDGRVVSAEPW